MKYRILLASIFLVGMQITYAGLSPVRIFHHASSEAAPQLQQTTLEKQLALLRKEKNDIEAQDQRIKENLQAARATLTTWQEKAKTAKPNRANFSNKKVALAVQIYQTLNEANQVSQQIKTTLEQHIKLLEEYQDPSFRAKNNVPHVNNFENLKENERRTTELQTKLTEFEKQKISSADELARRKKALAMLEEEYKEKDRQQAEAKNERGEQGGELSYNDKVELLRDQKQLLDYKKELAQLRIKDIDQRLLFLDSQIMMTREKLVLAKEVYDKVKKTLRVDDQEVKKAEQNLETKSQAYIARRDRLQEELRVFKVRLDELKRQREEYFVRLNVSPGDQALLRDWQKEPRAIAEWRMIGELGVLFANEALTNVDREEREAYIELEKAKFHNEEMNVAIIKSWHFMTNRIGMKAEERLAQDIKSYETAKHELQADITTINDKRMAHINALQKLNAVLDKIKDRIEALREQQNLLFKTRAVEYRTSLAQLYDAKDLIVKQVKGTATLIEIYSNILAVNQETLKKIETVVDELNAKGFWKRSTQSIDLHELRSTIPDIEHFLGTFWHLLIGSLAFDKLLLSFKSLLGSLTIGLLFLFLLRLLILVILFMVIRAFLPDVCVYLRTLGGGYGIVATASILAAEILTFIQENLITNYIWGAFFALIKLGFIKNQLIAISFYFLSIPYLLLMTYRLFGYLREVNYRRNYLFMNATYERRFMIFMQPLVYATIVIFFFREAFLLGGDRVSAVPTVLLAINFILLQIAVVSLLGKEEILNFIPSTTPLWEWVKDHVRNYYWFLWATVIAIIIMSNPYVGYGRQVFYVLSRIALTAMLIPLLLWLHHRLKQLSSDFFFYYEDGETMKERFSSAKMFYGLFIVGLLLLFMSVGIVIAVYLWGKQSLLYDVMGWLQYELYSPGIDEAGRRVSVTFMSLLKVILFVIGGGVMTYVINHFILKRVFDPLLIGAGVQNTIFTLTRYAGIVVALFIGMHSVGLDTVATKIAVFLGVLGFAVKEPLSDFFSYFIILVQRPIKIGDLIMVEKDTIGVVRHITPRSVIVKQRNSVTVIIPNSHITTKSIVNWSYSRSYSAFDDFFLTVPYSVDPARTRQLILGVLDKNLNILKTPAPIVRLHDFVDNGYQFLVRGFLTADKVYDQWDIASEIRFEIVRILRANSIDIAYPTRILRVVQSESLNGTEIVSMEPKK